MASRPDEHRVRFSEIRIPPEEAVALAVALLEIFEAAWRRQRAAWDTQMFQARRDFSSSLLHKGGCATSQAVRSDLSAGRTDLSHPTHRFVGWTAISLGRTAGAGRRGSCSSKATQTRSRSNAWHVARRSSTCGISANTTRPAPMSSRGPRHDPPNTAQNSAGRTRFGCPLMG